MKILLLLIFTVYAISGEFIINKANSKEIIYILEKNGYQIFYNLNRENLSSIFNVKIKNKKINEIKLLNLLIKNKPIKYTIKNKKIYFYNDYKKIKKQSKQNKKQNITIIIDFSINNNNDIENLINKLNKLNQKIIYLNLNYYKKSFNLILTKKNFKEILNNLKIKKIFGLNKIKKYQSLNEFNKNILKLDKILKYNEKLLYNINNNINELSNYYFPFVKSYIKYNNQKYYYLQNVDYKNNYKYLINGNNFVYLYKINKFNYFNYKCKINNNLTIKCYNNKYLLKIGNKK